MSCRACSPGEFSPEFNKQFKPENNAGCGVSDPETCDTPSIAAEGSALKKWEEEHGRVITTIVPRELGDDGRFHQTFEKTVCPKPVEKSGPVTCCSFRYKVVR
jgi:hypothetical protein